MRIEPSLSRRLLVGACATATTLLTMPTAPALGAGLSRDDISRKLSRVPVFTITNNADSPYLTEMDGNGKRSGFFFLG